MTTTHDPCRRHWGIYKFDMCLLNQKPILSLDSSNDLPTPGLSRGEMNVFDTSILVGTSGPSLRSFGL